MPRLLVVHHSPTRSLRALTDAVVAGAHDDAIEGVEVVVHEALDFARGEADHEDLLDADGYVLGTTANFGYMSGALKHVFDSTFLQIGGALSDDGSGAERPGARPPAAVRAATCTAATTPPAPSARCCRSRARSAGGRGTTCSRRWVTSPRRTPSRRTSSAVPSRHCSQ